MVFLQAPEFDNALGLEIQIRTKERSSSDTPYQETFVESVALKIGDDTLQVDSWGAYRLNGQPNASLNGDMNGSSRLGKHTKLGRFPIAHFIDDPTKHRERFVVSLDNMERVVISVFKDLVSVAVKGGTYKSFGSSRGLMGAFGSGTKLSRNNTAILDNDVAFAGDWQVRDTEPMLFAASREPQYPQKCRLENTQENGKSKKVARRHLRESTVSMEQATVACAHTRNQKDCASDVMQMSDLDLAKVFPRDD